jgi:hypothetical protein
MSRYITAPTLTSFVVNAVSALLPSPRRVSSRRVSRWCRRQGFQLLRWRDAKLFEGPSSWTPGQRHYRIQIVDGDGLRRAGYLVFARRIIFLRCQQVLWDDPSGHQVTGQHEPPTDDDVNGLARPEPLTGEV